MNKINLDSDHGYDFWELISIIAETLNSAIDSINELDKSILELKKEIDK